MFYSIIDTSGNIRLSQFTTDANNTSQLLEGERLLPDNSPMPGTDYDILTQYPVRVEPVSADATEVPYIINQKSFEEVAQNVRSIRDGKISEIMWRVERYNRRAQLGLTQTDNITAINNYIEELCNVPQQENFPFNVQWPVTPLQTEVVTLP